MKALVTGSAGFIGSHLANELNNNDYEVIKCDLTEHEGALIMDIMNRENIQDIIERYKPDYIFNMAGQANVALSWKKPQWTVELNTIGLINILETVRMVNPKTRVIAVGSSDEYGSMQEYGVNVTEDVPVKPITPYAISKHAQELFAQLYVRTYGLDVCMVRLFNLGGYGQAKGYMISDFASGIVDVETGKQDYMYVGNLESARDLTHVKDACRALRLIAEKGHTGEIYNISSGVSHKAHEVLDKLIAMAKVPIEIRKDPKKMRPSDTPMVRGNHDKLTAHTGWKPELSIDQILTEALDFWRSQNKN